jgi:chromosome segregation ATPase
MNTFQIFEQFRGPLGEEAARALAQTLGAMFAELKDSVTKEDFRILRESIDANVSRIDAALVRLAEAQERTEAKVGTLAEALDRTNAQVFSLAEAQARTESRLESLAESQARTEAQVRSLAEAQARTEMRLEALAEAQSRTESKVEALAEAQARTEKSLRELADVVRGLVIRSDRHEGTLLELKFRDRLPSYLGLYLRRAKVLQTADLLDELEPRLERSEVEDFLRADVLALGAVDGKSTYVIGEVSYTADADDVERAARRAALLRKAKLPAVGLVACEAVHPQTIAYAREQGVRVWADGRLVDEK